MRLLILPALLQLMTAGPVAAQAAPSAHQPDAEAIRTAIAAGRLEEASTLLLIRDAQHPGAQDDALMLARGELALARGSATDAERLIEGVAAEGALRCGVKRIRALALMERAHDDSAIDRLGAVAEGCAPDWRVWRALGTLLGEKSERDASRFAFAQALAAGGDPSMLRNDRARALIGMGDLTGAAETLQDGVTSAPQDAASRQLLDLVNGMRGFEPERAASDTDERWAQRLADAADGARRAGRTALARSLIDQALLASPRYDERLLAAAKRP
ncbi:hypothetical protein [Sphingobium nicotianae]|uniref:Tetratricopeptide repeat protein n=1 Tax=Sphingobium nicotianae TaxID=2782607 RepID=A0A9X1DBZ4_9SPHN|nr:hypothetical protein [Sphingobium nicotianae]MBT2187255.1 hypothetical protein [Sphingobium nicotianae]